MPPVGCQATPKAGCATSGRATLIVSEKSAGNERLKLVMRGFTPGVARNQFGDPVAGTTRFDVCVHTQSGALAGALTIDRAGDTCGTRPCWSLAGTGYRYVDGTAGADGVSKMQIRGGTLGKGSVSVKAGNKASKGQTAMPTGLTGVLQAPNAGATVQLLSDDGTCVEAALTTIRKSSSTEFTGKRP